MKKWQILKWIDKKIKSCQEIISISESRIKFLQKEHKILDVKNSSNKDISLPEELKLVNENELLIYERKIEERVYQEIRRELFGEKLS